MSKLYDCPSLISDQKSLSTSRNMFQFTHPWRHPTHINNMERLLIATLVLACLAVVTMVTGYATPGWLRYRIVYEHLGGANVEATYGFGLWRAKVCTLGVCEWYRYSATEDETAYTKGKLRGGGGEVGHVRIRVLAWRAKVCILRVCEWYRYSVTEEETGIY